MSEQTTTLGGALSARHEAATRAYMRTMVPGRPDAERLGLNRAGAAIVDLPRDAEPATAVRDAARRAALTTLAAAAPATAGRLRRRPSCREALSALSSAGGAADARLELHRARCPRCSEIMARLVAADAAFADAMAGPPPAGSADWLAGPVRAAAEARTDADEVPQPAPAVWLVPDATDADDDPGDDTTNPVVWLPPRAASAGAAGDLHPAPARAWVASAPATPLAPPPPPSPPRLAAARRRPVLAGALAGGVLLAAGGAVLAAQDRDTDRPAPPVAVVQAPSAPDAAARDEERRAAVRRAREERSAARRRAAQRRAARARARSRAAARRRARAARPVAAAAPVARPVTPAAVTPAATPAPRPTPAPSRPTPRPAPTVTPSAPTTSSSPTPSGPAGAPPSGDTGRTPGT